jgi:hypothetical protein
VEEEKNTFMEGRWKATDGENRGILRKIVAGVSFPTAEPKYMGYENL